MAWGCGHIENGQQIPNDWSETKNENGSILKEARKRGWESQQRLTHRRWESGPGVYTEIPDEGRSHTHLNKHTPVAGTSAGPQEKGGFNSECRACPACPPCYRRKLPRGWGRTAEEKEQRREEGPTNSASSSVRDSERVPGRDVPPLSLQCSPGYPFHTLCPCSPNLQAPEGRGCAWLRGSAPPPSPAQSSHW